VNNSEQLNTGDSGIQPRPTEESCAFTLQSLNELFELFLEADAPDTLTNILKIANQLTGAPLAAIYLAEGHTPQLKLLTGYGPIHSFPATLPARELDHLLNAPQHWRANTRPLSDIQRASRVAGFSRLTSAPLGQPNAWIGLLFLAGSNLLDDPLILPVVKILAQAVTSALQQRTHRAYTNQEFQLLQIATRTAHVLEEQSSEGIVVLTPELQIIRINSHAEMLLGYANREVSGQPAENVLIGSETLAPALSAAQQGNVTYNLGNLRLYRRNGEDFLALGRVFPVLNNGQVEHILVFFQDLSEQENFRQQTQQLEQRALLGEVTAVFAHEVRNPINNISTGLQLMAMNLPEDAPEQDALARMLQDCDRLAELMKSVLAFSRPVEYDMQPIDLPALLRRLMERLHPRITHLNVQHQLHVLPVCPPVQGNLRALEQVFTNLINNALQAMEKSGGRLALRVQSLQSAEGRIYVETSVADTGHGIPVEIQERIFQPFFTTESNGTGLGLAITKRIITAHKGNIRLESFPGGTIFYVQLPAAQADPANQA
jgi:PAS domain S-box-containing protein